MANIQATVDPQTLERTAQQFATVKTQIERKTDQMMTLVNKLNGSTWSGSAQQTYVSRFTQLRGDMSDIQKKLAEHIADLLAIAANVKSTEQANQSGAQALGTDFVQLF